MPRDWDLMSLAAVPLTFAVGLALVRGHDSEPLLARIGVLVCGAAALHTAGLDRVNATTSASEARFRWLLEHAALSSHAQAYGWETWANHARPRASRRGARGDGERAPRRPEQPPLLNQAGTLLFELGAPRSGRCPASPSQEAAADIRADVGERRHGVLCGGSLGIRPAVAARALELDGDLDVARIVCWRKHACRCDGIPRPSRTCRSTWPATRRPVEALFALGNVYSETGDTAAALECYGRVVELNPEDHQAYYNLGVCYYSQGRIELARPRASRRSFG